MIENDKKTLLNETSLKRRVVFFLISFIVLFAIVITSLSIYTLYNMKMKSISNNQTLILKQIESSINDFVENIEKSQKDLANSEEINESLNRLVLTNKTIDTILLFSKEKEFKKLYGKYSFDFINKDKSNIFKKSENSKFSEVFFSEIAGKKTIAYRFTLNENIIIFLINLEKLNHIVNSISAYDNTSLVFLLDNEANSLINNLPNLKTNEEIKSSELFTKLIEKNSKYELTTFSNICFGTLDNGMYTKIKNNNWYLIIRESSSLVENYLFNIIIVILSTIAIFTILAIILSKRVLSTIFIALEKFQVQTSNIANGNYHDRIVLDRFVEFDELSNSFEKMRYEINKRENHLKQSLKNFKVLIDSTMEAIVIHDTKVIIDINYSAQKILKVENKNDLLGKPIKNFLTEHYKSRVDEFLINNVISINPHEYEILNSKNEIRNVIGQEGVMEYEGKKRRISVFLDITDIKNKDKLIFQQSKMASIGEMLSNIAHQWRQPLNTIRTLASASKLENEIGILENSELIKRLDIIGENTVYLSKIIDDLSDYTLQEEKIVELNLSYVLKNALKFLESAIKTNNINIIKNIDINLSIKADINELTQIFVNILNNCIDAFVINDIKERYILITVQENEDKIFVSIKDSANGIDESDISKIFDPYFTTKHKAKGTGIGLYLTHKLITEHFNGYISAKNSYLFIQDKKFKGLEISIKFNK